MLHFLKADVLQSAFPKSDQIRRNLYCKGTDLEKGLITL